MNFLVRKYILDTENFWTIKNYYWVIMMISMINNFNNKYLNLDFLHEYFLLFFSRRKYSRSIHSSAHLKPTPNLCLHRPKTLKIIQLQILQQTIIRPIRNSQTINQSLRQFSDIIVIAMIIAHLLVSEGLLASNGWQFLFRRFRSPVFFDATNGYQFDFRLGLGSEFTHF